MNQTELFQLKAAAFEKVKEREYWTAALSGTQPDCRIPHLSQNLVQKDEEASLTFTFPTQLEHDILKASEESDLRMFIILMTVAFVLLHRYSGKSELLAAAPVLKQTNKQTAINDILPLKAEIEPEMNFRECLYRVKEAFQQAAAHQNYPVKLLLNELSPVQKADRNHFGVALALENIHEPATLKEMNADLLISIRHNEGRTSGKIRWNLRHYHRKTAERLSNHFCTLAEQALTNPEQAIGDLGFLSGEELHQIMTVFNDTEQPYPADKSIVDLFRETAVQNPDHPAVVYENVRYTYQEADELSDRMSACLREQGVRHDEPIGLMVHRSAEMVIAILGILKSGCPYLPIDVHLPAERIRYMVENSGTKLVVANSDHRFTVQNEKILLLEEMLQFSERSVPPNRSSAPSSKDLAYVLYTSGTTGKPKGVMIGHRQVVNLVYGLNSRHFSGLEQDHLNVGMLASHIFDASVQTMFPALLLGHTLCIAPDSARMDGRELWSFYEKNHIHISDATPSHLRLMVKAVLESEPHRAEELKLLLVGGEALTPQLVNQFLHTFGEKRPVMTNNYGPTECSVQSSSFTIPESWNEDVIPIGRPMPNEQIYILDDCGCPVPIGVYGELCIAGNGVGRGYIHQPELTAQRFTTLPDISADMLYRTGDLARWRPDGLLEFLGRNDSQVKIRGYRVELGEIKQSLLDFQRSGQRIHDAVVVPIEKGAQDQYLCAYVISDLPLKQREIREYLAEKLPGYMIPRRLIRMEKFPMNFSGKLDYGALPDPAEHQESDEHTIKAHNETEKKLIGIFAAILNMPESEISMEDNFFDIGGNSFNIVELSNKIKERFNRELSVLQLFQFTSVSAIAAQLDRQAGEPGAPAESEREEEESSELENVAHLLGGIGDE
ncbi:non-ribosomal peptide synthetase [Bacillus swezeyi]|uniref:Amino acid adenylation domain-containing protein n=1 Tax=Bacillus swezeyi TaxID=1925020 RepID=A0A5M8RHI8_9BACI|nr:non-ribosomal peptide synthetase [Bacillus swezeyi]KAA6447679.1 amino acid adenylation domain-containing protein [Bacillus swezeyi]TYS34262.1 amino acid adenylation domain-containing protein [Bacillus swezeyi]